MSPFTSLGLSNQIVRALADEGYETPTPIQSGTIEAALAGRDVLGCAQTGTGKTAAFALPVIHRLHAEPADKSRRGPALPRALVLSPTRELATQIADSFAAYGRHSGLSHTVIFGGVSQARQERALSRGVDVLVATPGRLMDLMEQGIVDLSRVRILVLDEADRMLDMGFIQPIRHIAAAITTPDRQTLLFSATMPREIMRLADSLLNDPVKVSVAPVASAAPLIEQSVYMVPRSRKPALLEHLLGGSDVSRALVFTRTKHGADRLSKHLTRAGVASDAIHGNKSQNQRERALAGFRSGRARVLVATDVAARGLDVDGVSHVFNFDLPNEPEAYVHRIGRTGRAGAAGIAISFCDHEERGYLRDIERLTGKPIPASPTPTGLRETARPTQPEPAAPAAHRPRGEPRPPRPEGRPRRNRPGTDRAPERPARADSRQAAQRPSSRPEGRSESRRPPEPAAAPKSRPGFGARKRPQRW